MQDKSSKVYLGRFDPPSSTRLPFNVHQPPVCKTVRRATKNDECLQFDRVYVVTRAVRRSQEHTDVAEQYKVTQTCFCLFVHFFKEFFLKLTHSVYSFGFVLK